MGVYRGWDSFVLKYGSFFTLSVLKAYYIKYHIWILILSFFIQHTTIILTNSCYTRCCKLKAKYTPPVQRSAWRWPFNWAETCSWNYNLIKYKVVYDGIIYFYVILKTIFNTRGMSHLKKKKENTVYLNEWSLYCSLMVLKIGGQNRSVFCNLRDKHPASSCQ